MPIGVWTDARAVARVGCEDAHSTFRFRQFRALLWTRPARVCPREPKRGDSAFLWFNLAASGMDNVKE